MLFSYKTKILADFQICISAPIIKYMAFLFLLTIYTLSLIPTTAITYVDLGNEIWSPQICGQSHVHIQC